MQIKKPTAFPVVFAFFLLVVCITFAGTAHAVEIKFKGGECSITDSSFGGHTVLTQCRNDTRKTVNDIHLTVSYLVESDLKPKTLDYTFPNVSPGGFWRRYPLPDPVIWTRSETMNVVDYNVDHVSINGHWTIDGRPIPEPPTLLLFIVGALLLGAMRTVGFYEKRG